MGLLKNSLSALGRLLTVVALAVTFLVGLVGVIYLQLSGEEITIPKVVGKNFNVGKDELTSNGLKIKKIASRYSNEEPNTILEQRPKAGTIAKTGLMISVIVSEPNPDGYEEPVEVKDDEEAIEEIESLPELKTDKAKKKSSSKSKKPEKKNRDVIKKDKDEDKTEGDKTDSTADDSKKDSADKPKTDTKPDNKKTDNKKTNAEPPKPPNPSKPKGDVKPKPKPETKKPTKTGTKKVKTSN